MRCGCNPPAYCPTAVQLVGLVERGRRHQADYGITSDFNIAMEDLEAHLGVGRTSHFLRLALDGRPVRNLRRIP